MHGLPLTLTVEEAGELLGISRQSAYRAAAGELPALRVGRRLIVPTARLLEMLGVAAATLSSPLEKSGA